MAGWVQHWFECLSVLTDSRTDHPCPCRMCVLVLNSTHINKCLPSTHYVPWEILANLHVSILSDVLAARVVVVWEKLIGQLINFDPLLTHSPSISSRWVLSIVATAWVGSITTCVIIFALGLPRHSYRTLSQFTSMVPENWSGEVRFICFWDKPYESIDSMTRKWATPLIFLSSFLMTPITW